MTHLVGWKTDTEAFICADSAVTWDRAVDLPLSTSSFGELHVLSSTKTIAEGAIKVLNFDYAALGIAGDARVAQVVVEDFKRRVEGGDSAREAFMGACANCSPLPPDRAISLLAAIPESRQPALLAFNGSGEGYVTEALAGDFVAMGSLRPELEALGLLALQLVHDTVGSEARRVLAGMLAFLQGMGVQNYILESDGVGGAYAGLHATAHAIHWQPSIEYMLRFVPGRSQMIRSAIWRNRLVVNSTLNGGAWWGFGNTSVTGAHGDQEYRRDFPAVGLQLLQSGGFEYFMLMDIAQERILMFETPQGRSTRYLEIKNESVDGMYKFLRNFHEDAREILGMTPEPNPEGRARLQLFWFPAEGQAIGKDVIADASFFRRVSVEDRRIRT